jgi:hypothetical protein
MRAPALFRLINAQGAAPPPPTHLYIATPRDEWNKEKIRKKNKFGENPRTNKAVLDSHRVDKPSLM